MTSRYIGQINAKYNSTDIIITPDRAAADQDGAPIVNTTGAQSISGAKTFTGSTTISGTLTAPNTSNSLKVADHSEVLTGNDVLSAKDIMTANGDANNLVHRSGNEPVSGLKLISNAYINHSAMPVSPTITPLLQIPNTSGVLRKALFLCVGEAGLKCMYLRIDTSDGIRVMERGSSGITLDITLDVALTDNYIVIGAHSASKTIFNIIPIAIWHAPYYIDIPEFEVTVTPASWEATSI